MRARRKYIRHVYLLTDAATPVEEASQLGDIVNMYADASMECKLHFVGLGVWPSLLPAVKEEEVIFCVACYMHDFSRPEQLVSELIRRV